MKNTLPILFAILTLNACSGAPDIIDTTKNEEQNGNGGNTSPDKNDNKNNDNNGNKDDNKENDDNSDTTHTPADNKTMIDVTDWNTDNKDNGGTAE